MLASLVLPIANAEVRSRALSEVWGLEGILAGETLLSVMPMLIWVSPRSILALLLSSSAWWKIKVAVARLSRQLGLLPRASICPVVAGVTRVWLGLEVGPPNRNCVFLKPQA